MTLFEKMTPQATG